MIHAPRDDPGNGLAHGLGRFPCSLLKIDTGGVDDLVPEVGGNLEVLLAQFDPLIKRSVTSRETDICKLTLDTIWGSLLSSIITAEVPAPCKSVSQP